MNRNKKHNIMLKHTILTSADKKANINKKIYQLFTTVKIKEKETEKQLERRITDKIFTLRLVHNPERFIATISIKENLVLIYRNKVEEGFNTISEDEMDKIIVISKN